MKRQRHDLKVFYMEESFKTAVSLICKVQEQLLHVCVSYWSENPTLVFQMYSAMQPTHKQFAVLKAAVGVLWETLLSILDFCPSHSSEYPALSSALVVLVPCADRPVPDCARCVVNVSIHMSFLICIRELSLAFVINFWFFFQSCNNCSSNSPQL